MMQETWVTQFKNAPEYADYMIGMLKQKAETYHLAWIHTDTSILETREEAAEYYNRLSRFIDQQITDKHYSLPVENPPHAFKQETTTSTYKSFVGWNNTKSDAIVSSEINADNSINICLTHLHDNRGTSVVNAIEKFATVLFATELMQKNPNAGAINWYIHVPAYQHRREQFMKVVMDFSGNSGYRHADFIHLDTVPQAIKAATFNAEQEAVMAKKIGNDKPTTTYRLDSPKP